MNLEELMAKLYDIYEENDCDGSIPITVSSEPFEENRIEIKTSETGEVSVNIQVEDN